MLTIDEQRFLNIPKLYRMKKQVAYSINREGKLVQGNGFKQNEPTKEIRNNNIWMHSIDRKDFSNPIPSFLILGATMAIMGLMIKWLA